VASNPGHISAGGREAISVEVHTSHRGGSKLHKAFTVYTNDPGKPEVRLVVSGKVKGYISLSPTFVRFVGLEGQSLSKAIDIKPLNGHAFAIKAVKLQKGEHLTFDLKPLGKTPGAEGYTLFVKNKMDTAGFYQDLIIVETDSARKPSLRIPVSARIRKKEAVSKPPAHD
jgi:hypothetical protein